ncbi:COG1470 family protein [Agromyces ramosus]|uniref:Hydrolytic protein n=1 Tax=Agromyces ramosus TaxID=33879 RepID=A0ABU0R986_9MICO|nr:hypothetical protein [Agromyces ramosus]MDQ0894625.1 hypothetical protein [Agromyces ramosus]
MATTATIDQTSAPVEPGTPVVFTVSVLNDTLLVESFTLSAVGPAAPWATIEPAQLTIYPGKSETATVTVLAPRTSDSITGEVPLGIRAQGSEQPDAMTVAETTLTILPFTTTTAELQPRIARGRGRARVRVAVDNRGNVPVMAAIAGMSSDALGLSTPTPDVLVDPGHALFVDVDLRPRRRLWRGKPVTHSYSVSVVPEGAEPIVLPGTYTQELVIPRWVWKALIGLFALLLLLLALWFLLLKPAIESAARDAVAEPLAEAQQQADEAAAQADKAAEAANEALTAVGQTPPPVEPVAPVVTTADVDIRLAVSAGPGGGTDESDRFVVPPNSVLRITDVVFSNPQGDFGSLTLENADLTAPIVTIGLENSRDLDFHFVTPVVLREGDELFANLLCQEAGLPGGSAPPPTSCADSVLISGSVVTTG